MLPDRQRALDLAMDTAFNLFDPQSPLPPAQPAQQAQRPRRWPKALLASAALLAVAGGGAAFLVSPYNHVVPLGSARPGTPVREPGADGAAPDVLAPAARMAGVPRQETRRPVRDTVAPTDPDSQLRELLGLHGGADRQPAGATAAGADTPAGQPEKVPSPSGPSAAEVGAPAFQPPVPAASPAAVPPPPSARPVMEPGMAAPAPFSVTPPAPAPPLPLPSAAAADPASDVETAERDDARPQKQGAMDAATQPAAHAQPAAPNPAATAATLAGASSATLVTPAPDDPVGAAIALRPNPMSPGEQVDVLHLVTRLGTVIRDLRTENAGLRASAKASSDKVDSAVADFERRLALVESHGAINAAMADMDAPPEPAMAASSASRTARRSGRGAARPASLDQQAAPAAVVPAGARRYKVQAASPGLAMLSELDRSGGEGSQTQVKVGDTLPGYGRVTAIQQQGVAWTVRAEHGAIQ